MGRIARLDTSKRPPRFLTSAVDGKRCRGRPFRTVWDAFVDALRIIIPEINSRGDTGEWIGHAKCEIYWCNIVKRKEHKWRGKFESDANEDEDADETTKTPPTSRDNSDKIVDNYKHDIVPGR